eukprot:TRINITY_DN8981_c0_g1_i2.p1 TRINITY_DN8981_c0_g1~~TRINITY_DN8981_c0_g1_i2.p1  ORF type:complete len:340 (+),score=21.90 TRINITY_DN8981_c0_g1_i2:1239-2258(+)
MITLRSPNIFVSAVRGTPAVLRERLAAGIPGTNLSFSFPTTYVESLDPSKCFSGEVIYYKYCPFPVPLGRWSSSVGALRLFDSELSEVIVADVAPRLTLTLPYASVTAPPAGANLMAFYWSVTGERWLTQGCSLTDVSPESGKLFVSSSHLTTFIVMQDIAESERPTATSPSDGTGGQGGGNQATVAGISYIGWIIIPIVLLACCLLFMLVVIKQRPVESLSLWTLPSDREFWHTIQPPGLVAQEGKETYRPLPPTRDPVPTVWIDMVNAETLLPEELDSLSSISGFSGSSWNEEPVEQARPTGRAGAPPPPPLTQQQPLDPVLDLPKRPQRRLATPIV